MPDIPRNNRATRNEQRIALRLAMKSEERRSKASSSNFANQGPPTTSSEIVGTQSFGDRSMTVRPNGRKVLPGATNSASSDVMRLPLRTRSEIKVEQFELNSQLNKIRERQIEVRNTLKSAKDYLADLRKNAPPFSISVPRLSTGKKPNARKILGSAARSALKNEKNRRDIEQSDNDIAAQERIVREWEQTLNDLKAQDHEIESQIQDKERELETLGYK